MKLRRGWRWPAALGCLLLPALGSAAAAEALGVDLEVTTGAKPAPKRPAARLGGSSAALLVLNAMSEARRQLLAESLARLAAVVDRKKNPWFVSLDDSEERSAVESLIAQTAPAFTAAGTLAAGQWQSPEGDVQIRPVAHCAPQRPCVRLAGTPGADDLERRARFLAWPLGYAIGLEVRDRQAADKVAEALRAPGSFQIGLVLESGEVHALRPSPALFTLQRHARRLVKVRPETPSPLFDALASLASAGTGRDGLAWLKLPPGAVLVVPRLGALATCERFVADVRDRLAAVTAKVEWLASPR
jgi:hypothetical protein